MPVIQVKEWIPDASDLANPASIEVKNAVPGLNSYKPFGRLITVTDGLAARPRGAIEEKDAAGNTFQYAGDTTKLYELNGTTWGDVSVGGGYATGTDERWEFTRWNEQVIATNFTDDPQVITLDGVAFADLTTDLKFRHVAVVRDFVVAGNTFDGVDGTVTHRVRWSAFNDATDWTVSPVTGSDFRDLKKGGPIQRIIGGEFGVIVSEKSTWRLTFVGSPVWFDPVEVIPGVGALAPGAVTLLGDTVYMWSEHGFVSLQGGVNPQFIGAGRVDTFLRNDLDQGHLNRISAVADPESGRIFWAYPGAGNTDGRPNKIAVYDRILNKWGYIEQDVELIWRAGGVATTLEALDDVNLGAELVSNGDFASDTIWSKGTGWTIAAGIATHAAGTASDLTQTLTLTPSTYYRVGFDVSGRTAGSVTPVVGGTSGTAISADATGILETIRSAAGSDIAFSATSDFDGSIDNVTLKDIDDIDSMSVTLDASQWKGGSPVLAGFDSTFKNGNFTGGPMTAVITTKEAEITAGRKTVLNAFRPLVDGGTVTAKIGSRDNQSDNVEFTAELTPTSSGRFTKRKNARYHRFQLICAGEWKDAIGVSIERDDAKAGAKR